MSSQPTRILLGITGSIAVYKTPELVQAFIKAGCGASSGSLHRLTIL
nr:hypothetical protein [Bacteroidota bacterium]